MITDTGSPIQANPSRSAQIKSRGAKIITEITGDKHTLMSHGVKCDSGVHTAVGIRLGSVWLRMAMHVKQCFIQTTTAYLRLRSSDN